MLPWAAYAKCSCFDFDVTCSLRDHGPSWAPYGEARVMRGPTALTSDALACGSGNKGM
jgi:hypothetical protein